MKKTMIRGIKIKNHAITYFVKLMNNHNSINNPQQELRAIKCKTGKKLSVLREKILIFAYFCRRGSFLQNRLGYKCLQALL